MALSTHIAGVIYLSCDFVVAAITPGLGMISQKVILQADFSHRKEPIRCWKVMPGLSGQYWFLEV